MAIWAVLSAPLIMSHDVRNTRSEFRDILLNPGAIAINQDLLGIGGKRIFAVSLSFYYNSLAKVFKLI